MKKYWKIWFWVIAILIAGAFDFGIIGAEMFTLLAFGVAAAAFYNSLVIKEELDKKKSDQQ